MDHVANVSEDGASAGTATVTVPASFGPSSFRKAVVVIDTQRVAPGDAARIQASLHPDVVVVVAKGANDAAETVVTLALALAQPERRAAAAAFIRAAHDQPERDPRAAAFFAVRLGLGVGEELLEARATGSLAAVAALRRGARDVVQCTPLSNREATAVATALMMDDHVV